MAYKNIAHAKAWRFANKEKIKTYQKAYRKAHKEKSKTYSKNWHKANSEKVRVRCKAYRETHKVEAKAYAKAYRIANLETFREVRRKCRALKYETQVEVINEKKVYLRDGWICRICHKRVDKRFKYPNPMSPSLDHIIPLIKGGSHTYANIQLAHLRCNLSKKADIVPQGEQLRLF